MYNDIIVCDYNYFFDPIVYLKRFFDSDASNVLVLVDEAHNLVPRARSMYSASFDSFTYKQVKHSLIHFEHKKFKNAQKRMTKFFNQFKEFPYGNTKLDFLKSSDIKAIENYLVACSDINKNHHDIVTDEFTDFYFELNKFIKILDLHDESFALYVNKKNDKDCVINLFCIDPSEHIKRTIDQVKGKIFFSATLSPVDYYINVIGGYKSNPMLLLPSPFKKENLK